MAERELRQIVLDLKKQRRQIDRAITALKAVIKGSKGDLRNRVPARRVQQSLPTARGNGTTETSFHLVRTIKCGNAYAALFCLALNAAQRAL
jgi:hypothetical protein